MERISEMNGVEDFMETYMGVNIYRKENGQFISYVTLGQFLTIYGCRLAIEEARK
jgi:hypothetical protein